MNYIQKIHTRISQVSNYEKHLFKISFNQGRDSEVFIKSNNLRDDFEGHSLERISIYNQNKLIKSFKLNYSYTTSTDQSNLLWYFTKAQGSNLFEKYLKRMFLANIEEEGSDGQKLPPYVFTCRNLIQELFDNCELPTEAEADTLLNFGENFLAGFP